MSKAAKFLKQFNFLMKKLLTEARFDQVLCSINHSIYNACEFYTTYRNIYVGKTHAKIRPITRKKTTFCKEAELNAFCTGLPFIEGSDVLVNTRTDIWQILVHFYDQYV